MNWEGAPVEWYEALDQRLAHLLVWDAPGHWRQESRCGLPFWPWFRARPRTRRCARCLAALRHPPQQESPP